MSAEFLAGDYELKGRYHEELDKNWRYLPVYLEKKSYITKILKPHLGKKILDLGCGEGVFVTELSTQGHNVKGLDLNFESQLVQRGNILATPFEDNSFDVVMCLDVIEHISISDHPQAFKEIYRILKPGGKLICSLPNLAHLASRVSFLIRGKLIRTATIDRHPGDRPSGEFKSLILETGFYITKMKGLFFTAPFICFWTMISPSTSLWIHRIYNMIFNFPSLCFLVIFECEKKK